MGDKETAIEKDRNERKLACAVQNAKIKGLVVGSLLAGGVVVSEGFEIILFFLFNCIRYFDQLDG